MILLQTLLPQHLLSALAFRIARCTWKPWKNFLIRRFIARYGVDLGEANHQNIRDFPTFNAFFTRALRPNARPIDPAPDGIVSPVDGALYEAGTLDGERMLQAKGKVYSVTALLGGDRELAVRFHDGAFATIYLSPRDYHRVHMPLDGRLEKMLYVPGDLFSVNPATTAAVDNLFARNERVVSVFRGTDGRRFVVCLVGAMLVGGMETVWHGQVTPARPRRPLVRGYDDGPGYRLAKGGEMGRFNMGSTVILLFEPGDVVWSAGLQSGAKLRMGQCIGLRTTGRDG
jgi:phosphatidylserine decarboxylase